MNEKINMGPNLEEINKQRKEQYYAELLADYFERHPETIIAPEDLREAGPEIAQFQNMITLFESTHSLSELNSIIDLTPSETPEHPIRQPAKVALIPINALLNTLKKETNISIEKHKDLKNEYMRLSRAVGMINNNIVDHNR